MIYLNLKFYFHCYVLRDEVNKTRSHQGRLGVLGAPVQRNEMRPTFSSCSLGAQPTVD
jgi:hypothetical protein